MYLHEKRRKKAKKKQYYPIPSVNSLSSTHLIHREEKVMIIHT